MVYLLNTQFKDHQKVTVALRRIYGIGATLASQICMQCGISEHIVMKQLSTRQCAQVTTLLQTKYETASECKQKLRKTRQRLIKIKSYRGFRHAEGYPTRGQSTHGNARTARRLQRTLD